MAPADIRLRVFVWTILACSVFWHEKGHPRARFLFGRQAFSHVAEIAKKTLNDNLPFAGGLLFLYLNRLGFQLQLACVRRNSLLFRGD